MRLLKRRRTAGTRRATHLPESFTDNEREIFPAAGPKRSLTGPPWGLFTVIDHSHSIDALADPVARDGRGRFSTGRARMQGPNRKRATMAYSSGRTGHPSRRSMILGGAAIGATAVTALSACTEAPAEGGTDGGLEWDEASGSYTMEEEVATGKAPLTLWVEYEEYGDAIVKAF